MNCPSRNDIPPPEHSDYNQSPHPLSLDTNNDLNHLANRRSQRDHRLHLRPDDGLDDRITPILNERPDARGGKGGAKGVLEVVEREGAADAESLASSGGQDASGSAGGADASRRRGVVAKTAEQARRLRHTLWNFSKFIGPGFTIAVAYIDPGNYATDVSAGASYKFQLLVMILVSNIIAIFLQSLCIKLGSVTGMNLAENCREHCPRWLNVVLYLFAEAAIIATDIAEVIGTAIALNLLIKVPLVAGCAISIVDVMIILLFYRPSGSMRGIRVFEFFVALLVLAVVVCFCIELSLISVPDVGQLFRGYLPSKALVQSQGLYQACGILGATVMPHSLYLGSGMVQPRLYEFDLAHGNVSPPPPPTLPSAPSTTSLTSVHTTTSSNTNTSSTPLPTTQKPSEPPPYRPSLAAIRACMPPSILELTLSLMIFALFVNSAILIVAGASLSSTPDAANASLFTIYDLLRSTLAPAAGTVFALALLLSGTSAGIVCTIAGQMVSEGALKWRTVPWVRRLVTRSVSITPSIVIAGAVGEEGLSGALVGSQVALSVILPVVSAPLIWFTCRGRYMVVREGGEGVEHEGKGKGKEERERERRYSWGTTRSVGDGPAWEEDAASLNSDVPLKTLTLTPIATLSKSLHKQQARTSTNITRSRSGTAKSTADVEFEMQPPSTNDANASADIEASAASPHAGVKEFSMKNHWITSTFAIAMWGLIVVMNVASWVLMGLGTGN